MGSNRHQVGGWGGVILAAAFVAGMVAAVGVLLDEPSTDVASAFCGLPDEAFGVPVEVAAVPRLAAPALPSTPLSPMPVDSVHAYSPPVRPAPVLVALPASPPVQTVKADEPTVAPPPPSATPALFPPPTQLVPLAPRFVERPVPQRAAAVSPPLISVAGERSEIDEPLREAVVTDAPDLQSLPAAPLPGANWSDPDGVNWVDAAGSQPPSASHPSMSRPSSSRIIDRFTDRRIEDQGDAQQRRSPALLGERLRSRLRGEGRIARGMSAPAIEHPDAQSAASDGWPTPVQLFDDLERLAASSGSEAHGAITGWAKDTINVIHATLDTDGPADPQAAELLLLLGERVNAGMAVADEGVSPAVASQTRRAALAVARRVAVWRAAAAWCGDADGGAGPRAGDMATLVTVHPISEDACLLLACLERYEKSVSAADASTVRGVLTAIAESRANAAVALTRAVADHYHAANVRIAVHRDFVSRMLPESTVTTNAVQDFVLGRPVKGRSTVEQSLAMRFVPHPNEIRMELVVNGEVASRTVTASGPVSIHSKGQATFTVYKPIHVTPTGLAFGNARGTALSNAQLASIETSFDNVPIMGSLVRSIAKNQHDGARQDANREVSNKVLGRACRQVDQEAEPKLSKMAEKIREKIWQPLVTLGLEPTPVALETTEDVASMRLRLAAATQLAAHTPRPRAPENALVSFQVHETVANNAVGQFGFAGQRLELPELARLVCERLGIDPEVPDDLPDGVVVTFARDEPLRLECRDGLVHVRVSLEAFECGRRNWYDVVAKVAYRPVVRGSQVSLEREGPVQISGPGHEGRMEIGLRTIFGKIFAQSRPVPLVPAKVTENPALAGLRAVQAVATDGWLAIALAEPHDNMTGEPAPTSPTAKSPPPTDRRFLRR